MDYYRGGALSSCTHRYRSALGADADKAVAALNGAKFRGHVLHVEHSRMKSTSPATSYLLLALISTILVSKQSAKASSEEQGEDKKTPKKRASATEGEASEAAEARIKIEKKKVYAPHPASLLLCVTERAHDVARRAWWC